MTAILIWMKTKIAAWLERPAAAIINNNYGPAPSPSGLTSDQARAIADQHLPPTLHSDASTRTCAAPHPERPLGSKEHGLTAGQEVRLNSCDVWMTVLYADCCEADCAWFDGHTMHQDTFPLACLTVTPQMPF